MDFKQLEAFVYVVKLKSFSKAAQRIYLTQPTISAHINSLEKELDTKLIERGTKYVYPTKPGSILYQYAIKMLNLRRPIYKQTAAYGHFGRNDLDLPWERLDKVDMLKSCL